MSRGLQATSVAAKRPQKPDRTSVDGRVYTPETETELNRLAFLCLGGENGQRFMGYLKGITLNAPYAGDVSNDALRHMEGQRWLVGMLANRIVKGAVQ